MSFAKRSIRSVFLLLLLISTRTFADSPLTSTAFYRAYEVQCNKDQRPDRTLCTNLIKRAMDKRLKDYLINTNIDLEKRLAVVNSLGWSKNGQKNSEIYEAYLRSRLGDDGFYSGEDYVILGYMKAMDDYFNVKDALSLVRQGVAKLPNNFAAQVIEALIVGQLLIDDASRWPDIWESYARVLKDFPSSKRNMLPGAVDIITNCMQAYQK